MNRFAVTLLRGTLILLAVGTLATQVLTPIVAVDAGKEFPELSHLVIPYSIAAIAAILCFQVALFAVWKLLSMAAADRIFSDPARRLVDVIVVCAAIATVLGCTVCTHLVFIEQNGGPGALAGLAICAVGGVTAVLVMIVVRGLLGIATADHHELIGVI